MTDYKLAVRAAPFSNGKFPEYIKGTPFSDIPRERQISLYFLWKNKEKPDKTAREQLKMWEDYFKENNIPLPVPYEKTTAPVFEYVSEGSGDLNEVTDLLRQVVEILTRIANS